MNNNPFQPANPVPPVMTPMDNDDFAQISDLPQSKKDKKRDKKNKKGRFAPNQPQAPVMMDGVSPVKHNNIATDSPDPIIDPNMIQETLDDPNYSADGNITVQDHIESSSDEVNVHESDNVDVMEQPVDGDQPDTVQSDNPVVDQIAAIAEDSNSSTTPDPKGPKSQKTLSISILTLIFFVLTLAGAGGSVYFFLQNRQNSSDLTDAQATISELRNDVADNAIVGDREGDQFTALQDRIVELIESNEEKQSTIEANEERIYELTARNATLTEERNRFQQQAANISDLTNRVTELVNILEGPQNPPANRP